MPTTRYRHHPNSKTTRIKEWLAPGKEMTILQLLDRFIIEDSLPVYPYISKQKTHRDLYVSISGIVRSLTIRGYLVCTGYDPATNNKLFKLSDPKRFVSSDESLEDPNLPPILPKNA